MAQSKLEQLAITQRNSLLASNAYDNSNPSDNYSATHTKAMSDNTTPVKGKGTGVFLDTTAGGGSFDINGSPQYAGSGRLQQMTMNNYNNNNTYDHPDTTGNLGQVIF